MKGSPPKKKQTTINPFVDVLYDENQQLREDISFKPLREVFSEPRTKNLIFTCGQQMAIY
jgi:hypothetical protein